MIRNPLMVLMLVVLSSGSGCGSDTRMDRLDDLVSDATSMPTAQLTAPSSVSWPYWPRRMRIHPLSQLATDRDTGQLVIETRIEFLDRHGHTCKAVGQVLIDLHETGGARNREPLETWVLDLGDASVNRDHYDELTRTYLFRLDFDPQILPERPELWGYFRSADGRRFQAEEVFELRKR